MKLLLPSLLILSVLVVLPAAYAEIQDLQVNANHKLVDIIGHSSSSDSMVYLTVWNSDGMIVIDEMPRLTDNGQDTGLFRYQISITEFNGFGEYVGQITDGNDIYDFNFSFKEKVDPTLTSSQLQSSSTVTQHEQDIERLQLEIQKKDNRIGELEDENRALKDKVSQLQDDINRMAQEFFQTIINQMDWFRTQMIN